MSPTFDVTLILPAYNERASIGSTIDHALQYFQSRGIRVEIIVAADGDDGTRELVREMAGGIPNLSAIGHEQRSGKGRGIREAIRMARGSIIGYADADNKVPFEEYDKIRPFLAEGYEVVIGSRGLRESRIERRQPWYRQIGSKGFRCFLQLVLGLPGVRDTQCGFKFFQRDIARELFEIQKIDRYMFDVEVLTLAHRFGYRIREVPIRWRDDGDTRLDLFSGNLRNFRDVLAIRASLSRIPRRPAVLAAMAMKD
jgi:dolichyl-phosphate beta-glucosyltransferase